LTTEFEVELVQAWPQHCESMRLRLAEGASVGLALQLAAKAGFAPAANVDPGCLAIHGKNATPATVLRAGDRIELLRPLLADPKQRRRERAGRGA
jgi:putative ubiquitin-RnfH superfamily antitoxin RatB of RatAB toxin-antitoxin module